MAYVPLGKHGGSVTLTITVRYVDYCRTLNATIQLAGFLKEFSFVELEVRKECEREVVLYQLILI